MKVDSKKSKTLFDFLHEYQQDSLSSLFYNAINADFDELHVNDEKVGND
jgi:hypothetical protein